MRIPYDSFVLASIVEEARFFVGGKIQEIRQPNEFDVVFGLYANGREGMFLISIHPQFARAHFVTRKPGNQPQPPQFLSALRSRLEGGRILDVRQVDSDRVLEIEVASADAVYLLVAELMGKHSNLMLLGSDLKVIGAGKWIGRSKSHRVILPGTRYERPSVMGGASGFKQSPFMVRLHEARGGDLVADKPVLSEGNGAYPTSVAALGLSEVPRATLSIALEQHFSQLIRSAEAESIRSSLLGPLNRVKLAREVALRDLRQAESAGGKAPELQKRAELILAYGPMAEPGVSKITAWDYDGTEKTLVVDPEKSYLENANAMFDKAKKAKARLGLVREQIVRIQDDLSSISGLILKVSSAERVDELRDLQDEARRKRFLTSSAAAAGSQKKEDRPFEGHRIRELVAPGGWTVLYGENAEANDYLTLRVAKPSDWWLHVRGATSSHVIVATRNQPDRVQRETLEFAAKVAVMNSGQKHAGFVPVDYTLKKYVRRTKGAPKGSVVYTHEKTLHVESGIG